MAGGLWVGNRRLLMHQASGLSGQLGRAAWADSFGGGGGRVVGRAAGLTGVGVGTIKAVRGNSS